MIEIKVDIVAESWLQLIDVRLNLFHDFGQKVPRTTGVVHHIRQKASPLVIKFSVDDLPDRQRLDDEASIGEVRKKLSGGLFVTCIEEQLEKSPRYRFWCLY